MDSGWLFQSFEFLDLRLLLDVQVLLVLQLGDC